MDGALLEVATVFLPFGGCKFAAATAAIIREHGLVESQQ